MNTEETFAYDALMKIPGVVCQKPGGAFYITCKLPVENTEDLAAVPAERIQRKTMKQLCTLPLKASTQHPVWAETNCVSLTS